MTFDISQGQYFPIIFIKLEFQCTMVQCLLMVQWVIGSILLGGPFFLISIDAPHCVTKAVVCTVLSVA